MSEIIPPNRRFGKTVATAWAANDFLDSDPSANIMIYSRGEKTPTNVSGKERIKIKETENSINFVVVENMSTPALGERCTCETDQITGGLIKKQKVCENCKKLKYYQ